MRNSKLVQILSLLCMLLAPLSHAASLGNLALSSSLGEPLLAEVEIQLEAQESLSDLQAALASEQAYAKQGIHYQAYYSDVKVELQKNAQGQPLLKLSSSLPINEPYLDVLIQLDWSAGRSQKQYIVLLDPAQPAQAEPEAIAAPLVNDAVNGDAANADVTNEVQSTMLPDQTSAPLPLAMTSKPGDTLYSLARAMQPEGVSLDQMLLGLYQANPNAFMAGNMNRLKAGQTISLPSQSVLLATQADQATAEVKLHTANWQAYRAALANKVLSLAAQPDAVQKQSASGKIATANDQASAVKAANNDVLKLSAGDKDAAKAADAKVLALQEDATAREKSLQESEARAQALQKQIKDMQQLLQLKNQSMAELQKRATDAKQAMSAKASKKRAAWADWLVLSLTLLAILAAFTWLSRSNKRRENLLAFKSIALVNDLPVLLPVLQASPEAEPVNTMATAVEDEAQALDLAGLDLDLTKPAAIAASEAESATKPIKAKPIKTQPIETKPIETKLKKKTAVTSFIKTDANEVSVPEGDMEIIRIDLSAISLDLSGTEDELTLANAIVPSTKTPNASET